MIFFRGTDVYILPEPEEGDLIDISNWETIGFVDETGEDEEDE